MFAKRQTRPDRFDLRRFLKDALRQIALRHKVEREIRALQSLSDDHLRDIGLYQSDVADVIRQSRDRDLLGKRR